MIKKLLLRVGTVLFLSSLLALSSCGGGGDGSPVTQAAHVEKPEPRHVEVMLAGSTGTAIPSGALNSFISLARQQDFLSSSSIATDSPLAPCALLSAATTSAAMNNIFAWISQPGSINIFLPRGTYIFGMYDADIVRGKGAIPRDNPNRAADMITRLVILHSWAISTKLNTLFTSMTQRECLELLVNPSKFDSAFSGLHPSQAVQTHAAPVSAYIASYRYEDGNTLLKELVQSSFLDREPGAHTNPLSPCSLLRAFRSAARLNDTWNKLTNGSFDAAGRSELDPYIEDIKDGKGLNAPIARTAEVIAAVFATEIVRANELTSQLTQDATERDCLEEIFVPGTLRIRLMKDASVYYNRGLAYGRKGQYDRAIQDFDQATKLNLQNAGVYYNRGLAYSNKGQYDRAIQDFDQAIRLNPQYAHAYLNRGIAYDYQGQRDRAIQDYDQAILLNPQDAFVYYIRGLTYNDQGQFDRAIQDYDQAIRLNPQDADVYDNRGHAYARNGQDERAIKDFKMVFELSAGDLYTLLSLEVSALRLNRSESQFILDNTSSENLDEWPGIIVRHYLGQKTEADVFSAYAHETGKQKKDKDCEAYFYLGQIHLTNGKTEKAIEYFKKSLATEVTGFVEYTGSKFELQRLGVQ